MVDIYCEDNKCPICNGDMILEKKKIYRECINKCYLISNYSNGTVTILLKLDNDAYHIVPESVNKESNINQILYRIDHWKENDRYLMELIAGSD